ncbi:MAG: hypothetical protein ACR2I2_17940 [Bryobacteraceae bacterium]
MKIGTKGSSMPFKTREQDHRIAFNSSRSFPPLGDSTSTRQLVAEMPNWAGMLM